ncbi:MAG: hypothetical protein AAF725_25530, partial [Acidobacteriota bacterium]
MADPNPPQPSGRELKRQILSQAVADNVSERSGQRPSRASRPGPSRAAAPRAVGYWPYALLATAALGLGLAALA